MTFKVDNHFGMEGLLHIHRLEWELKKDIRNYFLIIFLFIVFIFVFITFLVILIFVVIIVLIIVNFNPVCLCGLQTKPGNSILERAATLVSTMRTPLNYLFYVMCDTLSTDLMVIWTPCTRLDYHLAKQHQSQVTCWLIDYSLKRLSILSFDGGSKVKPSTLFNK